MKILVLCTLICGGLFVSGCATNNVQGTDRTVAQVKESTYPNEVKLSCLVYQANNIARNFEVVSTMIYQEGKYGYASKIIKDEFGSPHNQGKVEPKDFEIKLVGLRELRAGHAIEIAVSHAGNSWSVSLSPTESAKGALLSVFELEDKNRKRLAFVDTTTVAKRGFTLDALYGQINWSLACNTDLSY